MERDQTVLYVLSVSYHLKLGWFNLDMQSRVSHSVYCCYFAGHYCVANIAIQCPEGTYGPKEGLQRERDCAICPAGTQVKLYSDFILHESYLLILL